VYPIEPGVRVTLTLKLLPYPPVGLTVYSVTDTGATATPVELKVLTAPVAQKRSEPE
jgi:hypothetical protein